MKICIYGAGAIGSHLGMALAEAGAEVSLVARGAHLAAIREKGLTVETAAGTRTRGFPATDDPATLAPQDYVIVALKAHQVPPVADRIAALCGDHGAAVTAANGLPWWYFYGIDQIGILQRLETVDPGGRQWETIRPERAIGCVVYPAAEIMAPGHVRVVEDGRYVLGEPSGRTTERVQLLAEAMRRGGLKAPVKARIRDEIWLKLWGNLSFNPVSALTGATLEAICRDAGTRAVVRAMMVEAQTIAESLGVVFPIDVDRRIAGAEAVGPHKTSMLQDLEKGRPMEIDALVGSVSELGRLTGIATPAIDTILGLIGLKSRILDCSLVS